MNRSKYIGDSTMKPLLIIKAGSILLKIRESYGDMEDLIIAASGIQACNTRVVSVFEGAPLPDHDSICGAIITGSGAMVTDREPWSVYTEDWLREAHANKIPLLGICYGHQLLAQALGGTVGYHSKGIELGTVDIHLTETGKTDRLLGVMPEQFLGHVTHYQTVLALPPDSHCLAFNSFEPHQAFRIGSCTWGTQFHPEFTADVMQNYVEFRTQDNDDNPDGTVKISPPVIPHVFGSVLLKQFLQITQ